MPKRPSQSRKIKEHGLSVTTSLEVRKAYHEAAHAVFAAEYGMLQDEGLQLSAPMEAIAGAGGGVKIAWSTVSNDNRKDVGQDVEVLLAATVAEILLLEESTSRPNAVDMLNLHIAAAHDMQASLQKLSHVVAGKNCYEALRDGLNVVASKVLKRWPQIKAVAQAALTRGSLSRAEIEEIVARERHRPLKPEPPQSR